MKPFKLILFFLVIVVLQTVLFGRLNLWGASPDLMLVSVIVFAVLSLRLSAALMIGFSFGLLQDILSFGVFINVFIKVIVATAVSFLKESFLAQPAVMAFGFLLVLTPLSLLFEAGLLMVFFARQINGWQMCQTIVLTTIYNLLIFPLIYLVIEKLCHGQEE